MDFLKDKAKQKAKDEAVDAVIGDKPLIKKGYDLAKETFGEPEPEPTAAEKAMDAGVGIAKKFLKSDE